MNNLSISVIVYFPFEGERTREENVFLVPKNNMYPIKSLLPYKNKAQTFMAIYFLRTDTAVLRVEANFIICQLLFNRGSPKNYVILNYYYYYFLLHFFR